MIDKPKNDDRRRVIKAYTCAYPDPLIVAAGETLTPGKTDDEWPGWCWCTNSHGKSGWMPLTNLTQQGDHFVAKSDYNATELTAESGDIVTVLRTESGWCWCLDARQEQGWLPATHLQRMSSTETAD